jgi:hypothetical protein
MSCHKLIDHICALGRVGEESADELYQLMCLEVDESTFIKEVADICQGGLLKKILFKRILICHQRQLTKSSERYENLSHAGTHPTTKEGYNTWVQLDRQPTDKNVLVQEHPRTALQGHVISDKARLDGGIRLQLYLEAQVCHR